MSTPIKLRAEDSEDLLVVSACLQDAIIPIGDMCYQPADHRFVIVANRFKWEGAMDEDGGRRPAPASDDEEEPYPFERTHTAVRFDNVRAVRTRGIDLKNRGQILELLSLEAVEEGIILHFAGGGCIRIESAGLHVVLEDMGEPWPTGSKPCHAFENEGIAAS